MCENGYLHRAGDLFDVFGTSLEIRFFLLKVKPETRQMYSLRCEVIPSHSYFFLIAVCLNILKYFRQVCRI